MKNMIKYKATVTAIGPMVAEFLEHGMIVLFGETAPDELAEFAIIHDGQNDDQSLTTPLAAGDSVCLGEDCFNVLAVGDVAGDNLNNLGHLVLKFNGENEAEMPGDVCVEKRPLPAIDVGMTLQING